jgi:hypothetical protein
MCGSKQRNGGLFSSSLTKLRARRHHGRRDEEAPHHFALFTTVCKANTGTTNALLLSEAAVDNYQSTLICRLLECG